MREGGSYGTPAYMAPEQWWSGPGWSRRHLGRRDHLVRVTERTAPLSRIDAQRDTATRHFQGRTACARAHRLRLPEEVSRIVRKAMDENPDQRFQTAAELLDSLLALDRLLSGVRVDAPRPSRRSKPSAASSRSFSARSWGSVNSLTISDPREFHEMILAFSDMSARAVQDLRRHHAEFLRWEGPSMLRLSNGPRGTMPNVPRAPHFESPVR